MASRLNKSLRKKIPYKFLVSACLSGKECAYDGKGRLVRRVKRLVDSGQALAVCAEVLGGLPVPRHRYEIAGGDGNDVWQDKARVLTAAGKDATRNFKKGAKAVMSLAKKHGIKKAILKSKSPSCGAGKIYDGTFTSVLKKGDGVLTSLLRRNRIKIQTAG